MNMKSENTSELTATQRAQAAPDSMTYYVFALLFLLYFFDYVDRMIVTSLFPFIQKEWGHYGYRVRLARVGGLLVHRRLCFSRFHLVDRWSRKKTIGIMALLWRAATVLAPLPRVSHLFWPAQASVSGRPAMPPPGPLCSRASFRRKTLPNDGPLEHLHSPRYRHRHRCRRLCGRALGMAACVRPGGSSRGDPRSFFSSSKTIRRSNWLKRWKIRRRGEPDQDGQDGYFSGVHPCSFLILTNVGFIGCIFVNNAIIIWLPTYFHRVKGVPSARRG